jgi:hypothetical protein
MIDSTVSPSYSHPQRSGFLRRMAVSSARMASPLFPTSGVQMAGGFPAADRPPVHFDRSPQLHNSDSRARPAVSERGISLREQFALAKWRRADPIVLSARPRFTNSKRVLEAQRPAQPNGGADFSNASPAVRGARTESTPMHRAAGPLIANPHVPAVRHIPLRRAARSTVARWPPRAWPSSAAAAGRPTCSKRPAMAAGMKRERAA